MIEFLEYPNGLPLYWRKEASGNLALAVERLFSKSLQDGDLAYLHAYIKHWLNYPNYVIPNKDELLTELETAMTANDILRLCRRMAEHGIDPF